MTSIEFIERNSFFDERDYADATEVISVTDAHTALKLKELEILEKVLSQGLSEIVIRIEQLNKEVKNIK